MDELAFRAFLENQQTTFAEFESLLEIPKTGVTLLPNLLRKAPPARLDFSADKPMQTRFDDACRCLAEAYIQCNDGQRVIIRELMVGLPVVAASMGIPPEQIQTKIDGARLRLALVFESIKDLRPDEKEAARRLERLREAAMIAGVDPNSSLQEVAWMSSDECHSGRKSMRELLLFLIVPEDLIRCPQCLGWFARRLRKCPHCEALNPAFAGGVGGFVGEGSQTAIEYGYTEVIQTLPTLKLIGYVALCFAMVFMVMLTIQQIVRTFQDEGYHQTRGAWSTKAVILILAGIGWCCRDSVKRIWRFYVSRPYWEVGCGQILAIIGAMIGALFVFATFMSFFAKDLGW